MGDTDTLVDVEAFCRCRIADSVVDSVVDSRSLQIEIQLLEVVPSTVLPFYALVRKLRCSLQISDPVSSALAVFATVVAPKKQPQLLQSL